MNLLQAALLGAVQGLTEFLPVSSSGHLVLARGWFGVAPSSGLAFEVVVHLGTLCSVLTILKPDVLRLTAATPRLFTPASWGRSWREDVAFREVVLVGLATVPAVVVGLLFKDDIEPLFDRPALVAVALLVTAAFLTLTRFVKPGTAARDELGVGRALAMGVGQAFAIIPGISRSGATISAGLFTRTERECAGSFSFLMAIPAILGAAVLELGDLTSIGDPAAALAVGFVTAFVTGCFALKMLLWLLRVGRLWVFAPYLVLVAVATLIAEV